MIRREIPALPVTYSLVSRDLSQDVCHTSSATLLSEDNETTRPTPVVMRHSAYLKTMAITQACDHACSDDIRDCEAALAIIECGKRAGTPSDSRSMAVCQLALRDWVAIDSAEMPCPYMLSPGGGILVPRHT